MFKWLCYGHGAWNAGEPGSSGRRVTRPGGADPKVDRPHVDKSFMSKREFSFTIENDIYIRYLSFRDEEDMVKQIQTRQPHKIDIGAIYTHPVRCHAPSPNAPPTHPPRRSRSPRTTTQSPRTRSGPLGASWCLTSISPTTTTSARAAAAPAYVASAGRS